MAAPPIDFILAEFCRFCTESTTPALKPLTQRSCACVTATTEVFPGAISSLAEEGLLLKRIDHYYGMMPRGLRISHRDRRIVLINKKQQTYQ